MKSDTEETKVCITSFKEEWVDPYRERLTQSFKHLDQHGFCLRQTFEYPNVFSAEYGRGDDVITRASMGCDHGDKCITSTHHQLMTRLSESLHSSMTSSYLVAVDGDEVEIIAAYVYTTPLQMIILHHYSCFIPVDGGSKSLDDYPRLRQDMMSCSDLLHRVDTTFGPVFNTT